MIVSLSFVFIAGVASTTKAFANEPGSVFLWGGYDDDGLLEHTLKSMVPLNTQYLVMLKKDCKN